MNLSPGHAYKPSMEVIEFMKDNAKNLSVVPEIVSLASSIYRDIQVSKQLCRRCNVPMVPGKALHDTLVSMDDFGGDAGEPGTTLRRSGPAVLVDCLKCPECGRSVELKNKK